MLQFIYQNMMANKIHFCISVTIPPPCSFGISCLRKVKKLCEYVRERQQLRMHSDSCLSMAITLTKTVCLFWLLACTEAVVSLYTVFNNRSSLSWEPLSLSSIQPLELQLTHTHACIRGIKNTYTITHTNTCQQPYMETQKLRLVHPWTRQCMTASQGCVAVTHNNFSKLTLHNNLNNLWLFYPLSYCLKA